MTPDKQQELVRLAQREAAKAASSGNPPFGAIVLDTAGKIVARAHNTQRSANDPTAHAEINLLRKLGRKEKKHKGFEGYCVITNAEPCSMCISACIKAGIGDFIYGAPAEDSMNPFLQAKYVAARAKTSVRIAGNILAKDCARQIREARKHANRS